MKKALHMFWIVASLVLLGVFLVQIQNRDMQFMMDADRGLVITLKTGKDEEFLYPWFDETTGLTYFFLPSFVQDNRIYCDRIKKEAMEIDGKSVSGWKSFEWEEQTVYSISYDGMDYDVVFMKSANLPSLFIETDSGSMDYLNADKENEEAGEINLIMASGSVEYQG